MTVCANRTDNPGFFTGCGFVGGCKCARDVHLGGDAQVDQLRDLIAAGWEQSDACRLLWGREAATFPATLAAAGAGARGFVRTQLYARLPWLRETAETQEAS